MLTIVFDLCIRKVIRRPVKAVVTRWNSDYEEVKATNIFMGDLMKSLSIMLDEKDGIDRRLLTDANGNPVDRNELMFTPAEINLLRQYECAAEPVVQLSRFFQLDVPTAHLVLLYLRAKIDELRDTQFMMYGEISYSDVPVLSDRKKTEIVGVDAEVEQQGATVIAMVEPIYNFRILVADDLESRCKLTYYEQGVIHDMQRLPKDIAIGCLLNPLAGGTLRKPLLITVSTNLITVSTKYTQTFSQSSLLMSQGKQE